MTLCRVIQAASVHDGFEKMEKNMINAKISSVFNMLKEEFLQTTPGKIFRSCVDFMILPSMLKRDDPLVKKICGSVGRIFFATTISYAAFQIILSSLSSQSGFITRYISATDRFPEFITETLRVYFSGNDQVASDIFLFINGYLNVGSFLWYAGSISLLSLLIFSFSLLPFSCQFLRLPPVWLLTGKKEIVSLRWFIIQVSSLITAASIFAVFFSAIMILHKICTGTEYATWSQGAVLAAACLLSLSLLYVQRRGDRVLKDVWGKEWRTVRNIDGFVALSVFFGIVFYHQTVFIG